MAEYIEREAVVRTVHGYCHTIYGTVCGPDDVVELYEELKTIPAADVVEARSGVWTEKIVDDWTTQVNPFMRRRFYCSACGDWNTHGASKYCPNCGAKMDGGGDE